MQREIVMQIGTLQKWNDEKGYGFIKPNTGDNEVFIHIKDFTRRTSRPKIGDVLVYRLTQDNNGKQRAVNAYIQWDTQPANIPKKTAWLIGELRIWDDAKGYGFIAPRDGGRELFVHINDFKHDSYRPLVGGTTYYRVTTDENGKLKAYDAIIKEDTHKTARSTGGLSIGALIILLTPIPFCIWVVIQLKSLMPAIVYLSMSAVVFLMYLRDKQKAQRGDWRTPEAILHSIELLGGWPGALLAQKIFRHKSQKRSYQITFWGIVGIHWIGWIYLVMHHTPFKNITQFVAYIVKI